MTGITRKKRAGVRPGGFLAGAVLMIGLASSWLTPCSGMDTLTQAELGELSGRTGITMAFGDTVKVEASFNALSFGDLDGWGNSQDDNAGWLVLIGDGSNTGTLSSIIPQGAITTIDVGTTGAVSCTPAGGAPYAGILIPASTPFFTFSLTKAVIGLSYPATVNICLSNAVQLGERVGYMNATNLMIEKADMKSTCYIWAH